MSEKESENDQKQNDLSEEENVPMDVKNKEKKEREHLPSAVDDCADVTSRYEKFKKILTKIY